MIKYESLVEFVKLMSQPGERILAMVLIGSRKISEERSIVEFRAVV